MLKAVVFDVGYTLMNEERVWRAWAAWLNVPQDIFFAVFGSVIANDQHHHRIFEILQPGLDLKKARQQRENSGDPDRFIPEDLYPDVVPCISALAASGLRIGIAGNGSGGEQACHDLNLPVDFISSSVRWGVEKPSPAFFERIARELRLPPSEIAYVGDRLDNDVLPARAAGMMGILIRRGPWGYLHWDRPEAALADLRIHDLAGLPEALMEARNT